MNIHERLQEWYNADISDHVPTPEPQSENDDPVFIGNRKSGKTVVVGEENHETIYTDDMNPVDLEEVR
jgi:hypothetical protein